VEIDSNSISKIQSKVLLVVLVPTLPVVAADSTHQFSSMMRLGVLAVLCCLSLAAKFPGFPTGVRPNIGKKFTFLKETKWHWNGWRDVVFEEDGRFEAPTPECEAGACRWSANRGNIYILWGEAGLHTLTATALDVSPSCLLILWVSLFIIAG
jgi:hypothetical protein